MVSRFQRLTIVTPTQVHEDEDPLPTGRVPPAIKAASDFKKPYVKKYAKKGTGSRKRYAKRSRIPRSIGAGTAMKRTAYDGIYYSKIQGTFPIKVVNTGPGLSTSFLIGWG